MRSEPYHEIVVQKIPICYDTAIIPSIAVVHRRYCQEDPYYSLSSGSSWRTRDRWRFQEDPYNIIIQGSPPGSKCIGEWRKDTLFSLPDAMIIFVCNTKKTRPEK